MTGKPRPRPDTYGGRLGAKLCELREAAGWTIDEAATEAEVAWGTWYRWERGHVPSDRLEALAAMLGAKVRLPLVATRKPQ